VVTLANLAASRPVYNAPVGATPRSPEGKSVTLTVQWSALEALRARPAMVIVALVLLAASAACLAGFFSAESDGSFTPILWLMLPVGVGGTAVLSLLATWRRGLTELRFVFAPSGVTEHLGEKGARRRVHATDPACIQALLELYETCHPKGGARGTSGSAPAQPKKPGPDLDWN
jgi:hypothetical protein